MDAVAKAEAARAEEIRVALRPRDQVVVASVGTIQGRMVDVVRTLRGVVIVDPAVLHAGRILVDVNTDQAQELADALTQAVNR